MPLSLQAAWFPQLVSILLCFPPFYSFVYSISPHHRKRWRKEWKGGENKPGGYSFQRKFPFKPVDQNCLKPAFKSCCFLQLPSFTLENSIALRKWKTLTFHCKRTVAQSHGAHNQCQGVHCCWPTSIPNDPRASVSSLKNKGTHKSMVTY